MSKRLHADPTLKKRAATAGKKPVSATQAPTSTSQPASDAFAAGNAPFFAANLSGRLGSARTMPESVRTQMEGVLGADFSSVELYESSLVSDGGALAAASGNKVAFAPGAMDFGTSAGLELLGHELSHVASQARGEVSGHGLVQDSALEHKADLDGRRAASFSAFDSVSGQTLTPMGTGMGTGMSAAPVQAKKGHKKSRGDVLREEYQSASLPDQVKLLHDYAMVSSFTEDTDESEQEAYAEFLTSAGPEFVQEMINQQIESARALNSQVIPGDERSMALAQNSSEGDNFQGYSTLLLHLGMQGGNESAQLGFRALMERTMENDANAQDALSRAQKITADGHRTQWAQDHPDEINEIFDQARASHFAYADRWNTARSQRTAEANKNRGSFFSRLFRRRGRR